MKYLIKYKLFESKDEVLNTIEDMLFDLYDNGYNVRKSVELLEQGYFYSWSTQTYSEKTFEDPETGEEFHFDGVFDQLQVTITSNIKSRKWDKWDNKNSTILRRGKKPIDVDSIKDFLLQLSDYSKSQGYDITLYFGNTSLPFTEEILQPGVSQLGYTYEVIKMWDPEYITIVIHRNTVYEKYLESFEERRSIEINLIEDHKEYVRELFYDLMDLGYVAHPSYDVIPDFMRKSDKDNMANCSIHITKSSRLPLVNPLTGGLDRPFIFSDIVSDVDRFMRYLKYMKADSIQCVVIFANYDDDQKFIRRYGRRHSWEDLKQKIKEYIDTPAVLVGLQINYSININ